MSKRDRPTLKKFFSDGALPSSEHYGDLIESMVNRIEDGFDKTEAEGLRIASLGASPSLLSFYRGAGSSEPAWVVRHGGTPGTLHLRHAGPPAGPGAAVGGAPELALAQGGRVGVHTEAPAWRLDVDGVVRSRGRIGFAGPDATVPADGRWHAITEPLGGCNALEVVAGVGGAPGRGRYSLMHAVALNAYNPRNPLLNWLFRRRSIRRQTAMFGSYADRLRLRWQGSNRDYRLELRSQSNFGAGVAIRYYVTRLWFDAGMQGSRSDVTRDDGVA